MQEIIKIEKQKINHNEVNCINARGLWTQLESKQDFSNWIKSRLEGFVENIDYISHNKIIEREIGSTKRIEYFITMEVAKHICMMERNEKGKQIRQYFIKMEEIAKQQNPFLTATKKDLLKLALEQEEKIETLQLESTKKQEIIDEYITIDNNKTYTETAKILHLKPNKFIEKLRNLAYISTKNIPYQRYINCGYFLIKKTISNYGSQTKHFESYLITPKGFEYFLKQKNEGIFDTIKI